MKKEIKSLIPLVAVLTLLSGCNSSEMDALRNENESLRAELSSAQSKIEIYENELATTTETTDETTSDTEDETVPTMTAEEILSYIAIGGAEITDINSADGVSVAVYWRNNSDKEIKYITFNLEIINAVGDVVANQIGKTTLFPCRLTGPVKPTAQIIEEHLENPKAFSLFYKTKDNDWESMITNPGEGTLEYSIWNMDRDDYRQTYTVTEENYDKVVRRSSWDTIMYNPTAHSVNIVSINVEYMDGTIIDIDSDSIEYAFINY